MRFRWSVRPEDLPRADIPTLLEALGHRRPEVRLAAAVSLADRKTRDPGVMEALTGVAGEDEDSEVRAAAGAALHLIRTRRSPRVAA